FAVTLSVASDQAVTVNFTTAAGSATAGSDYQATSGVLTFAPGETSKMVTVLINGDRLAEPDENFYVNLSSPTNAVVIDGQAAAVLGPTWPTTAASQLPRRVPWPTPPPPRPLAPSSTPSPGPITSPLRCLVPRPPTPPRPPPTPSPPPAN